MFSIALCGRIEDFKRLMASSKAIAIGIDLGTTNFSTLIYSEDDSAADEQININSSHVLVTTEFTFNVGVSTDASKHYPEYGIYGIFDHDRKS